MAVTFHDNQIEAAEEVYRLFDEEKPFTVLLAQMQSGKTGAYLYTGFEMIRKGKIDNIMIICGSTDVSLKTQLVDQVKGREEQWKPDGTRIEEIESARDIYSETREEHYPGEMISSATRKKLKNVKVYFANELKKLPGEALKDRTLIIHDESHYAQSKENIPFEFYKRCGIQNSLRGEFESITEREIFILGVSATPFSEIIANKKVVEDDWTSEELSYLSCNLESKSFHLMKPGDGYIGVSELLESGAIKFEAEEIKSDTNGIRHIAKVLSLNRDRFHQKFCVIRTHRAEKDREIMEATARQHGYHYCPIFGGSDKDLSFMENVPLEATVVHICGRFRMGQVVPKRNIAMVYEQSNDPNTDTILQGLLGRMCGYHSAGANTDISVYLAPSTEEWVQLYDHAWKNTQFDTLTEISKAMNLGGTLRKNSGDVVSTKVGEFIKTTPIKFHRNQIERGHGGEITRWSQITANDMLNLFSAEDDGEYRGHPELIEGNPDKEEILQALRVISGLEGRKGGPHSNKEKTNRGHRDFYEKASSSTSPSRTNFTTYGVTEPVNKFSIYCCDDGVGYLLGFVPYRIGFHPEIKTELASVNPKCNYIPSIVNTEDPDLPINGTNGVQLITFDWSTSDDPNSLRTELTRSIERSLGDQSIDRAIKSIFDSKSHGYKGIVLSRDVYNEEIIQRIKTDLDDRFGINIVFKKSKGRQPKYYIRYMSISW